MKPIPSVHKLFKPRAELLLHPNIPKPLHGVNPRTVLGQGWWDKVRKLAYKQHGFRCHACGVWAGSAKFKKILHAHEVYDINYLTGEVRLKEIVALCWACHMYIHSGMLKTLIKKKQITTKVYKAVLKHGRDTLRAAGFKRFRPAKSKVFAAWSKWRLIFQDGTVIQTPYKDYEEWRKKYGR
uniref:Uncharacterized protein n=1 Tax=viral metagenome TaxID=1070528 RepID=A0A6M3LFV5_9ZZZZ